MTSNRREREPVRSYAEEVLRDAMALGVPGSATTPIYRIRLSRRVRAERLRADWERTAAGIDPKLKAIFFDLAGVRRRWPLLLWGPPGTGKTLGSLALSDQVEGALTVDYGTVAEHVRRLQGIVLDEKAITRHWEGWRRHELTIVDELGQGGKVTDFAYQTLWQLADDRQGKPSIWISNVSPQELAGIYDDRIISRIACGTVLRMDGADRRMKGR